jgi:hypothetical protein
MPRVGFETTIQTSKRAKTVHALDHSATVTGNIYYVFLFFISAKKSDLSVFVFFVFEGYFTYSIKG